MSVKKITSLLVTAILVCSLFGTASAALPGYGEELQNAPSNTPTITFTDVPTTHWASKYISEMASRKVLEGYPDGKFRPENQVSRAEFATIIVKASGLQAKKVNYSSFSDVKPTDWYSPYIEAVKDYMTGYRTADGSYIFNPTAPALREDITVALVKLKGYDVARLANRSIIEAMFKDYAGISEAAKDYVAVAVENGLVSGYQDETFRPQASITRAEAATLLWRAYQYGNDNKGVGGGNQTTTTTPTPPVTQPTTPATNPSTPSQPQQPSQAAKFSVDTLVGGMGQGDVDGPVSIAKINEVDSMVLDKEDNIFFLDQSKNKIRKFNKSNGRVETFKSVDNQFDGSFSKDGKVVYYDHNDFRAKKLTYSHANNRLYLLGFSFSNPWTDQIFELTSSAVSLSTYGLNNRQDYNYRFFRIDNNNNFVYGRGGNWTDSFIYSAAIGSESQLLASEKDATGVTFSRYDNVNDQPLDVITADNNLYVLDTGNRTLTKIQLFPRKVETVVSFDNLTFNNVTAYNGMFYVSSGSTIYELNLNGKLSTFIAGKDLTYNDGNPINKISQLSFDSNGNVIVYDDDNKAIRRINL
ncbi:S-layer homology domain-containing protein [Paenibacillus ehimensis]|uniref:S-layer homology domain-containing protein n=1 Tax=Paenibacillus ehimensis TaxID=79264 RepID=UPI000FD8E8D7|nr:S-layer homology domain-containing protein [Paenibacillus ehimensis]